MLIKRCLPHITSEVYPNHFYFHKKFGINMTKGAGLPSVVRSAMQVKAVKVYTIICNYSTLHKFKPLSFSLGIYGRKYSVVISFIVNFKWCLFPLQNTCT